MHLRLIVPLIKRACIVQRITRLHGQTVKTVQNSEVKDEPIKFSTSEAGQWKAKYTTSGKDYFEQPRIQPFAVVMSLTAFMVYFCILREENDLDDWLRNLENELPLHLEEAELKGRIEKAKRNNQDTTAYEERMENIVQLRAKIQELK
ncbi:uncharacterized protein NPIL_88581 [Nephila pilipes]|uniref:Uncharacterized protein n=1 Tax=Nephila pilipes TaxID=299642 RepID=A0A8X6QGW5_NEPPI|nr:uncharacterized protein NPIL_88581 [Nephila pilipes]